MWVVPSSFISCDQPTFLLSLLTAEAADRVLRPTLSLTVGY